MESVKVVVQYSDGRVIKGSTQDFFPNKDCFHLFAADKPSGETIEVFMKELKAIFIVRDFIGEPLHNERKRYIGGEKPS